MIFKNQFLKLFFLNLLLIFQNVAFSQDLSSNEFVISMIEKNIEESEHALIIKDFEINIDDVLLTDSGNIGYVKYEFTAIVTRAKSLRIDSQIKYTMTYEGSQVPQLQSDLYFIGINRNKNNEWEITDEDLKIALPNKKILKIVENLIGNESQ